MCSEIRRCTTNYDCVLRSTNVYYEVRLCTTKYDCVLRSTNVYYEARLCAPKYEWVLRSTTVYYEVRLCTTSTTIRTRGIGNNGAWAVKRPMTTRQRKSSREVRERSILQGEKFGWAIQSLLPVTNMGGTLLKWYWLLRMCEGRV